MNARLDIDHNGSRVTRDGRTYKVNVEFYVEATDMDDARYWAADNLAALADMLMLAEGSSGPVIDDDAGKIGEWSIKPPPSAEVCVWTPTYGGFPRTSCGVAGVRKTVDGNCCQCGRPVEIKP